MRALRFPSVLILFCLISLSVNAQDIALTNAVSSNTGEYEERIAMEIRNGEVLLGFMFTNVSGPFDTSDFASEPSFISIGIVGISSPDDNRTVIIIILNASEIVGISDGKMRADILKTKFENFFDIVLPYDGITLMKIEYSIIILSTNALSFKNSETLF